jgi:5'-methylthioadenosine phosphorylase
VDLIGMTNLQEAKLAREAEICYVTLALVTDYDCWHPSHDSVTVDMIVANLQQNSRNAQAILRQAVVDLPEQRSCGCGDALKYALITDRARIPAETAEKLRPIVGKYLS